MLNLELDINQVMANGETVIIGTQCSGVTGTWESAYTSGKYDHWWSSSKGSGSVTSYIHKLTVYRW